MEKYPLENIGAAVSGTEFRKGVVLSVNTETDKAEVDVDGDIYTSVPVFYKCTGIEEAYPDGSVRGSAAVFTAGDDVIVCFIRGIPLVIGFTGGARPCFTYRTAYQADGGWYIAKDGEIIPDEFVSDEDFESGYTRAEPLADSGGYATESVKTEVDACLSITSHKLILNGTVLTEEQEYYDFCVLDTWGGRLTLSSQGGYAGLSACIYEHTAQEIIDGDRWIVERSYRLGFGSDYDETAHLREDWFVYPVYSGEKIRSFSGFYGGRNSGGEFLLTSCVTGTNTEDTGFTVYMYGRNGLQKQVFPCSDGRADFGIGEASASAVLIKVRNGGGSDDLEKP
ncbi:hypothetical protein EP073_11990 [Geovibrio thiophilus]|uniref:Uncharacterized protein n=1 Tax=Geovibrio thiophilus TaxID=139438 RepID=A0A3R5Y8A9_9BACT|nr:hypothetical protein [Geovibrio thiophilus]QAR34097.1 hypothetical protein EP073_11990 [Geovibrio thiophilus]